MASWLPMTSLRAVAAHLGEHTPTILLEILGPQLSRNRDLDNMPFDLQIKNGLQFEHLAGLFASTRMDHGVIVMTIRQTAYLFGLVRQMKACKVIEIGRYKGGSTIVIAAAMEKQGQFWSIDIGEKETRLHSGRLQRAFDEQIKDICKRFDLGVNLVVGDSQIVEIDTGPVDLVFIDGDHSYDGVRNDFERFGRRVHIGGAVLFDDAVDEGIFKTHSDTVGRLLKEIVNEGEFRLVKTVNRLAHLERTRITR